jgi:hypothetical protein
MSESTTCSWLHCFLIEHVENTGKVWKKMVPVILAVSIFTLADCPLSLQFAVCKNTYLVSMVSIDEYVKLPLVFGE